jgi:hypothetical protein
MNGMSEGDKTAAETDAKPLPDSVQADVFTPQIAPLELQPVIEPDDAECYQLAELLCFHDRKFVNHLYLALRKRSPTPAELVDVLDDLRSGRFTKVEIIERLLATQVNRHPTIRVEGLSSPALRRVARWPFIGYLVRMFSGFTRLPIMIRHQQEFEAYALAQQQNIADYLNEVLAPAVQRHEDEAPAVINLSATVADTVESVLILSDSLVELSGRLAEFQTELRVQLEQLQAQQTHQTQTQSRLEADLGALINTQTVHTQALEEVQRVQTVHQQALEQAQRALEETQHAQTATAAAQQEFLIQEQQVIVETQKVVLGELQRQLNQLIEQQRQKNSELSAQVIKLQALVGTVGSRGTNRAAGKRVVPKPEQA